MIYFLFAGDILVMAFMIGLFVWLSASAESREIERAARIPLEDERSEDG